MLSTKMIHYKCRNIKYPLYSIQRITINDDKVPWSKVLSNYDPPEFNSPYLTNKDWADPDTSDSHFKPNWNALDENVNRKSHTGDYEVSDGRPLNPIGRTGLRGRGVLGKWGPNHAADPIVTRWKRDNERLHELDGATKLPILQFCAIQRKDCNEWAIPGGMVDPGENVNQTLMREFLEEALNSLEADKEQAQKEEEMVREFFKNGEEVFRGYVDDPRNTDNAWVETVAVNFHDEDGYLVGKFPLKAGDDAKNVQWTDIDKNLSLYASHAYLLMLVTEKRKAHW